MSDEIFLALIAYERLYLKADAQTPARPSRPRAASPSSTAPPTRSVSLGYWSAPAEALDSPALMQPWARLALQAALRGAGGQARQGTITGRRWPCAAGSTQGQNHEDCHQAREAGGAACSEEAEAAA